GAAGAPGGDGVAGRGGAREARHARRDDRRREGGGTVKALLDSSGPAAPPRRNGELVFDAPWQSRAFGLTVALEEARRLSWDAFRKRLRAEIAAAERSATFNYWACWLAALEKTCAAEKLCVTDELEAVVHELAARPDGHDHDH